MIYRYFGLVFGFLRRTVTLVNAQLGEAGAHAAVWAGCNADENRAWVQGGVFLDDLHATVPSVYIECKGQNVPGGYTLTSWPMPGYGIPVRVELRRRHLHPADWRVVVSWREQEVNGVVSTRTKRSQWVRVAARPTIDADLELLGPSSAVAYIGGKRVTGTNKK